MVKAEKNIATQLAAACAQYAHQIAYTSMGRSLTYLELDELSDHLAAYLLHHTQLQSGDRVAIQLPNILQFPIAALAVLKAGMLIVNTNPEYSEEELKHQLNDSGAKALIVYSGTALAFQAIRTETAVQTVIVTNIADLHPLLKSSMFHSLARLRGFKSCLEFPAFVKFSKALSLGKSALAVCDLSAATELPADDVALLQYTGGTTGVSKGSMLSHKNLLSNLSQLKEHLGTDCPIQGSIVVAPLPLYHVYAFSMNFLCSLVMGYHNILIPNPRYLSLLIKDIKPYKINVFCGINPLFQKLCEHPAFPAVDFSELHVCTSGGMALTKEIAELWYQVTACKILEGYGLTESSPLIACNSYQDYQLDYIGKALPQTELKIINEYGESLASGEEGELCVRGPQIMRGYWQQSEATSEVLDAQGWLRTGDIAVLDNEGHLKIIDRLKDMIIISGFNVYPSEIEVLVRTYPGVKDAVVIGVKDRQGVEQVKLLLVVDEPGPDKESLLKYCKTKLAAYKVPKDIEFRESLPKSNIGKILRRELKNEYNRQIQH